MYTGGGPERHDRAAPPRQVWAHAPGRVAPAARRLRVRAAGQFNIPVPGGTTAHAVGGTLAAIVLGPWAAVITVSVALVVQALFFGDGGITAIGANCFNMADPMQMSSADRKPLKDALASADEIASRESQVEHHRYRETTARSAASSTTRDG